MENVVLLADRNSFSWKFAEKIRDIITERYMPVPLQEVEIKFFRNKEIDMHVPENVRNKDVYFIHDSDKFPQDWWVELLLLQDLILSASAKSLTFILPNILYSRKDRKDKPHVPISARALAKSISSNLKRIITMDLHASQIQGFYPENVPLDNLYSFPDVVKYLKEHPKDITDLSELVVVSPDVGGTDRARAFAQRLGSKYSIAFIEKRRLKAGEIEEMRLVGNVEGKNVLIVDDIIDSGNTLCKAAELLKKSGAKKILCYGTHAFFTLGTEEICNKFDRIMTSNTHSINNENIEIIDMSSIFAETIYRAQKGYSISSFFK